MTFALKWREMFLDGSSVTYDAEANAGYIHVFPNPDAFRVQRTIEYDRLNLDIDQYGNLRGIETFGEPTLADAILALRWIAEQGCDDDLVQRIRGSKVSNEQG